MKKPACLLAAIGLVLFVSSGCQRTAPAAAPASTGVRAAGTEDYRDQRQAFRPQFADEAAGVAVLPVEGFELRQDFRRSYFGGDQWKSFAGPDSVGRPLAALVLQGSNEVTAAELRLGSSNNAGALAECAQAANSAETSRTDEVRIDGQVFHHFRAADAAMSHYLDVDAYRAVRHGHCIAIDLLVVGTRPEVYDPPRTPPFDQATAKARLQQALAAVRITR
ncbi:MAG TPA: hypothetical protein VM469_01005 [Pseudoxanthomonas sp.]|nr:hypothetical protein [Pseudoxanthomonas sp.]